MSEEIKEILNKFDLVLGNYELDKKFKQFSVDSICHLFPNEMLTIKDTITNLQQKVEQLEKDLEQKEAILGGIQQLEYKCEQLENIRKEAIEYIKSYKNDYAPYELSDYNVREILNILNKGSGSNE